jgi:hypothetical protein
MASKGREGIHPKVTFPCPRGICPGPASKCLSQFTDGAYEIRYQVLKIVFLKKGDLGTNKDLSAYSKYEATSSNPTFLCFVFFPLE